MSTFLAQTFPNILLPQELRHFKPKKTGQNGHFLSNLTYNFISVCPVFLDI